MLTRRAARAVAPVSRATTVPEEAEVSVSRKATLLAVNRSSVSGSRQRTNTQPLSSARAASSIGADNRGSVVTSAAGSHTVCQAGSPASRGKPAMST